MLVAPRGVPWRLDAGERGTLDDLVLAPAPELGDPLAAGQVRIGVRAAGVNFRDVLTTLGGFPGQKPLVGLEGAGVVLETGPDVRGLEVGGRVFGLFPGGLGSVVSTDERLVAHIPGEWSFEQAASVPVAFLTAYYGLRVHARFRAGESVLVHAGAGAVGMAAIQLARTWGMEVFATACPTEWDVLRELGVGEDHIASSRTLGFEERFRQATDGRGVDVVLNSLAGDVVGASLRLLALGGRFVEVGEADGRPAREIREVAARYSGVVYLACDLFEVGPACIRDMLEELLVLFRERMLRPLPVRAWDVCRAVDAFRFMSQARHTGKIVLNVPQPGASNAAAAGGSRPTPPPLEATTAFERAGGG
jgi:NADPH:quinone reductase-like Zn-dependent oxidoreductase